jgi:mRNA interferase YafQ
MLKSDYVSAFRKDLKRVQKRNFDVALLKEIIKTICDETALPPACRDHALNGFFADCRECHILPDWLLIYKISGDTAVFLRTGTHSDLF